MVTAFVIDGERIPLGLPMEGISLQQGDIVVYRDVEFVITHKRFNFDRVQLDIFLEKKKGNS